METVLGCFTATATSALSALAAVTEDSRQCRGGMGRLAASLVVLTLLLPTPHGDPLPQPARSKKTGQPRFR